MPRTLKWTRSNFGPLAQNGQHNFARDRTMCLYRADAIFSYIPKNACSTMRFSVALYNGAIRDESELLWIHKNNQSFAATFAELARASYAFVILRDPFTRLASCFVDKIVGMSPEIWVLWSSLDRAWEIKDLSFRAFVEAIALRPRLNEHWCPQSDFLIYDEYDDYFAFEDMVRASAVLQDRIGLEVRDTRNLVGHGSNRFAVDRSAGCQADTPIGDLIGAKNARTLPPIADFYDAELIDRVATLFAEDIALYRARCGLPLLPDNKD